MLYHNEIDTYWFKNIHPHSYAISVRYTSIMEHDKIYQCFSRVLWIIIKCVGWGTSLNWKWNFKMKTTPSRIESICFHCYNAAHWTLKARVDNKRRYLDNENIRSAIFISVKTVLYWVCAHACNKLIWSGNKPEKLEVWAKSGELLRTWIAFWRNLRYKYNFYQKKIILSLSGWIIFSPCSTHICVGERNSLHS